MVFYRITMKTAIYQGNGGISVEERPIPVMGETDVLIRNLRAGICGTDINIVKMGSEMGISSGSEFGHEMVSEVIEVGKKVPPGIKVGMIVGINPETAKRAGRRYSLECGGFSQYVVVEDAKLDYNLFEVNPDILWENSALMEPLSAGRHGALRTQPTPKDHIVILEAGPIGLGAAVCLIAEGISNICVVDLDEWRLERAREIGVKTLNTSKVSLKEGLINVFGGLNLYEQKVPDIDIFIDAAGSPTLHIEVMKLVKPRSRISVIAVYKSEIPINLMQVMSKEITLMDSSGYSQDDIKAVVKYINSGKAKTDGFISGVYKLDNIREAFSVAIQSKNIMKVLIHLE